MRHGYFPGAGGKGRGQPAPPNRLWFRVASNVVGSSPAAGSCCFPGSRFCRDPRCCLHISQSRLTSCCTNGATRILSTYHLAGSNCGVVAKMVWAEPRCGLCGPRGVCWARHRFCGAYEWIQCTCFLALSISPDAAGELHQSFFSCTV